MKHFAFLTGFLLLSQIIFAQNTWTGSTTSTSTTGNAAVGTTVDATVRLLAYNTASTVTTNFKSYYNNTSTASGAFYGIYNETRCAGTGPKYGVYSYLPNVGTGNRYAMYAKIDGTGDSRAAYFDGPVESKGDFIMGANNGKFLFSHAWVGAEDFMSIAPNSTGVTNTWEFNKELRFNGTGELVKNVPDATTRAFTVNLNGDRTFQVMGNGKVYAREVEVSLATFPDYVFDSKYPLLTMDALRTYIDDNKHLPNVPSACEIEENGIGLGDLGVKQMEKIEELTLYLLQLDNRLKTLETENASLKVELNALKTTAEKK